MIAFLALSTLFQAQAATTLLDCVLTKLHATDFEESFTANEYPTLDLEYTKGENDKTLFDLSIGVSRYETVEGDEITYESNYYYDEEDYDVSTATMTLKTVGATYTLQAVTKWNERTATLTAKTEKGEYKVADLVCRGIHLDM